MVMMATATTIKMMMTVPMMMMMMAQLVFLARLAAMHLIPPQQMHGTACLVESLAHRHGLHTSAQEIVAIVLVAIAVVVRDCVGDIRCHLCV